MEFDEIEKLFDVADKISSTDIETYKDTKLKSAIKKMEDNPGKLSNNEMNAINMYNAFNDTHQIFKTSLNLSKDMLNKIHENLMVFDEDLNPEMITAYASLQKNITDSIKTIASAFKLLSEAKKNLETKPEKKIETQEINIKNVNLGKTTKELLEQLTAPIDIDVS